MGLHRASRSFSAAVVSFVVFSMAACSTMKSDDESKSPTLADKVSERVAAADKAQSQGKTDEAFNELDAASELDPTSKLPWLKKAQIHFDARMYGQAISEAQEVLQRDNTDITAKSILAVSGLRVSADALDQLRKVDQVKGSTRSEAEAVAKVIREALGEPILLPPPAASAPEAPQPKRKGRYSKAPVHSRSAESSHSAGATASAKAPTQSAAGRGNPFGALQ
ncbi:MAG: hypothetical protein KGI91_02465 [Burkholderiales bacterium]|nr:hypothetical protein [Burkholderiales bacterium]HET8695389.1 hypothetical protein [Aquabacterium sp.]